MLYETSGMDRSSDDHGTAAIMEGTRLCCTCQLREILHCLGGVPVLLPLLSHLGTLLSSCAILQDFYGVFTHDTEYLGGFLAIFEHLEKPPRRLPL